MPARHGRCSVFYYFLLDKNSFFLERKRPHSLKLFEPNSLHLQISGEMLLTRGVVEALLLEEATAGEMLEVRYVKIPKARQTVVGLTVVHFCHTLLMWASYVCACA